MKQGERIFKEENDGGEMLENMGVVERIGKHRREMPVYGCLDTFKNFPRQHSLDVIVFGAVLFENGQKLIR